jgi:hypothetical protein
MEAQRIAMREFIFYCRALWAVPKMFDEQGSHWPQAMAGLMLMTTLVLCVAFPVLLVQIIIAVVSLIVK